MKMFLKEFLVLSVLLSGSFTISEAAFLDGVVPDFLEKYVPPVLRGANVYSEESVEEDTGTTTTQDVPVKKLTIEHQDCNEKYGNRKQKKNAARKLLPPGMEMLTQMLPWNLNIPCLITHLASFDVFNNFLDAVEILVLPCRNRKPSKSQCQYNATFENIINKRDYVPPKEWPCLQKSLNAREFYVELDKVYKLLNPCASQAPKLDLDSMDPSELKNDEDVGIWVHAIWWFWWYFMSGQVVFHLVRSNHKDMKATTYEDGLMFGNAFDPRKPTKLLIHGYINYKGSSMNRLLKHAYLNKARHPKKASRKSDDEPNVIVVDWSSLSFEPYPITRYRIVVVSKVIVVFLRRLVEEYGVPCTDLHLIGHSLGAHIAGIAGNLVGDDYYSFCQPREDKEEVRALGGKEKKFGRITGLDPANPLFFTTPDKWRLGRYSARFVDVIHTSDYTFGDASKAGHVDFYVNSGLPIQPGCGVSGILGVNLGVLANFDVTCSHFRAVYYYAESIKNPKAFKARQCSTVIRFKMGRCDDHPTTYMGEKTPRNARGIYYLDTASKSPYGLGNKGV